MKTNSEIQMITVALRDYSLAIQPVAPDELDAVLNVYRQCEDFLALGPVPTASMEMVLKDIEISKDHGGLFCGIYTLAGEMIGIIDYVPRNFEGDAHSAYLSLLMIAAPFRKQGIGRAVVETIEKEIKKNPQIDKILAGVQVNNSEAVQFWQRNGYRIVGGPKVLPDQTTVFDLRKDISHKV